ncbi:MAG TPA: hypothetical protein VF843_13430 [Streptosporangiaceae bacterium]
MTLLQPESSAAAAGAVLAEVPLSGGRVLTVRAISRADVAGLENLFDGLPTEDRYFRFFSYSRPGRSFVEQMTRAQEDGACHLVAEVSGPSAVVGGGGTAGTLIAEAGYVLLPDGNGEFAMTVAAGWRGWLGPYLLDALVAAAAARGVPNLVADILADNTRMLSLVKDRGYAVLCRDGPELRVAIDAARPRAGRQPARPGVR